MIKERLWYGKDERGKQGYAANYLPVLGLVSHRGVFTLIPEEIKILQRIFNMRAAGASYKTIADTFNSEGIKSKKGKMWDPTSVCYILHNNRYIGIATWNGQEVPAQHPPLVDIEVWNKVQEVNKERTIPSNRGDNPYLVKLWCHDCGRRMYGWTDKAKAKIDGKWKYYNEKPRYLCMGYRGPNKCHHKVKLEYVHDIIFAELQKLFQKDVWDGLVKERNKALISDDLNLTLKEREKALKDKESFLLKIDKDYAKGELSAVLYSRHFDLTTRSIKALKIEIDKLKNKLVQRKISASKTSSIKHKLRKLIKDWDSLSNLRKKEIITTFFPRIELSKTGEFYITRRLPFKL
jgi:hypothetical protein